MKLNESQLRSADHFIGPSLVLAGPGSGKTAVITYRVKNLIEKYHIAPESILVASFSRAAAEEMEERFYKISKPSGSHPVFGTFHSIFYGILKKASGFCELKIITEGQKIELLRSEMSHLHIDLKSNPDLYRSILNDISRLKSFPNSKESFLPMSLPVADFFPLCRSYLQRTKEMGVLDYDDILLKCFALLNARSDLLDYYRKRYPFILIDEFQDINPVQYEIIKLISHPFRNLFVVGDDDQSIYGFRGASPGIMKKFLKDYPDAKINILNTNYRSFEPIVLAATAVIQGNKDRFEKSVVCDNSSPSSSSFVIKKFTDYKEEYSAIITEIKAYQNKGGPLSEIAVLFRNRFDGNRLARRLIRENIPVSFQGNFSSIFSDFLALDLIAFMKCALALVTDYAGSEHPISLSENNENRANLIRILNKPSRYISRIALQDASPDASVSSLFLKLDHYYQDNPSVKLKIDKLKKDLVFLSQCSPYASITYIRKAMGYDNYLKEYSGNHQIDFKDLEDDLEELTERSKGMTTLKEWLDKIKEFESQETVTVNDTDAVQIMTMHASKGLEFNIVYLPDLNQGILPGKKADTPAAIAEERRLLYVAMTRARKSLRMGYTEIIRNKKAAPSEFLDCFFH